MNFFTIRLSQDINKTLTKLLIIKETEIEILQLNQLKNEIKSDSILLLLVSGGKSSSEWWINNPDYRGTMFIATVISDPEMYEGNNFKLRVKIQYQFARAITKDMCVFYPDTFNTDIGPKTKGTQTQAISLLKDEHQVIGVLRTALSYNPEAIDFYTNFFEKSLLEKIKAPIRKFIECKISYEEEMQLVETKKHGHKDLTSTFSPEQIIYYGVPGSGKSYKIDQTINSAYTDENMREEHTMRVVFHPEYTNADFVGQIMPIIGNDNGVEYKFTPGPFTKILRRAYLHPAEEYFLVIEEINRGNAAAIFGDIFQLMDRLEQNENDGIYSQGWSKYCVNNDFINWYIRQNVYDNNLPNENNGVAIKAKDEEHRIIEINSLQFSANTGIRLPPNLSLYATMNTSDQNVFALDNAFQRRWDMKLIKNECSNESQNNALIKSNNQSISWKDFQQTINEYIGKMANESGLSSMEDKRLGCWFVKAENRKIKESVFVNKVLKYLWDDAFKFSRSEVFEGNIKTFEELQERFSEIGFEIFKHECGLKDKIITISNESNSQSTEQTTKISDSQE